MHGAWWSCARNVCVFFWAFLPPLSPPPPRGSPRTLPTTRTRQGPVASTHRNAPRRFFDRKKIGPHNGRGGDRVALADVSVEKKMQVSPKLASRGAERERENENCAVSYRNFGRETVNYLLVAGRVNRY